MTHEQPRQESAGEYHFGPASGELAGVPEHRREISFTHVRRHRIHVGRSAIGGGSDLAADTALPETSCRISKHAREAM